MTTTRSTGTSLPGYTETMPCEPQSARRARLLVCAALDAWGIGELAEVGTLIVTELISNAVSHTPCRVIRVVIRHETAEVIRIGVADKSRDAPEPGCPEGDSEGGRGLLLVESLSRRWGYDLHRWGKVVWAELRASAACGPGRTARSPSGLGEQDLPTDPTERTTMFRHMDRFPTGSPLPQGHLTAAPWGLRRIAPYPPVEGPAYATVALDPVTQTARYFDPSGAPTLSPGHGTSSGTNPSTGTTGQGDRNSDSPDSDTGNDTDQ